MDSYTFEWAIGRREKTLPVSNLSLTKMTVQDNSHAQVSARAQIIVDWNKSPQVTIMGLRTDSAFVNIRGIPLVHLRAVTDEILSQADQSPEAVRTRALEDALEQAKALNDKIWKIAEDWQESPNITGQAVATELIAVLLEDGE